MAVHHFERLVDEPARPLDLRVPRRFATVHAGKPAELRRRHRESLLVRSHPRVPVARPGNSDRNTIQLRQRPSRPDRTTDRRVNETTYATPTPTTPTSDPMPTAIAQRQSICNLLDASRRTAISLQQRPKRRATRRKTRRPTMARRNHRPTRQRQINATGIAETSNHRRRPKHPSNFASATASAACLAIFSNHGRAMPTRSSSSTATSNSAGQRAFTSGSAAAQQAPACS